MSDIDYAEHITDHAAVLDGVAAMLRLAGEDPDRPGLTKTPQRFLNAWLEMTERTGDPEVLLATVFDDAGPVDQMVTVGPVEVKSICEHHLLPFTGHAWIAYIPAGRIVGLSKLPRLLQHYARRPQVQERLTAQVTTALDTHAPSKGSACLIRATHMCATMRGVRTDSPMTTSSLTGLFRTSTAAREEFLAGTRTR